jgi:hypothetical protein
MVVLVMMMISLFDFECLQGDFFFVHGRSTKTDRKVMNKKIA